MKKSTIFVSSVLIGLAALISGCSTVQSTGEAVSDVGEGAGNALVGTADAVGDAGMAIGRGAGDIVEGTGEAIQRGAKRTEQKGY